MTPSEIYFLFDCSVGDLGGENIRVLCQEHRARPLRLVHDDAKLDGKSRSLYDLFIRATMATAAAKKSRACGGLSAPQRKATVLPYLGSVSSSQRARSSGKRAR